MPVRKVSNRGGNIIGRFPSIKMGRMIAFESLLERDFIYLLDHDPAVDWFEEQPLRIEYLYDGKRLQYTPDFHVIKGDEQVLVECKPARFVETEENRRKFAVGREWCEEQGWSFQLVTDQKIRRGFRLQNIKLLTQYARQPVDVAIRSQIHAFLCGLQKGVSVEDLANAIQSMNSAVVMANIFCLAYHHEIQLPLDDERISSQSIVSRIAQRKKEMVP
jgi:hypothetical protein